MSKERKWKRLSVAILGGILILVISLLLALPYSGAIEFGDSFISGSVITDGAELDSVFISKGFSRKQHFLADADGTQRVGTLDVLYFRWGDWCYALAHGQNPSMP